MGSSSVGEGIPPDKLIDNFGGLLMSSVAILNNTDHNSPGEGMLVDNQVGVNVSTFQSNDLGDESIQNRNIVDTNVSNSTYSSGNNTGAIPKNTDNAAAKKPRPVFKYSRNDIGPFIVYVEDNKSDFKGSLNAIKVGGIILAEFPESDNKIKNISSIGKNRVKIICADSEQANSLIESPSLLKYNLIAYIPTFLVYKRGVIRGVCKDYSEESLKNIIRPFDSNLKFEVQEVKRIKRKLSSTERERMGMTNISTSTQDDLVPTQSIIVDFKANSLPKYVVMNRVRCEVEPYIQKVLLCYNCFRFGHIGKQCKSSIRCLLCGDKHNKEKCDKLITHNKCLNCQGGHLTTQLNLCPEFKRQKNIKTAMSQSSLSYNEAARTIPKISYADVVQKQISAGAAGSQSFNINQESRINTASNVLNMSNTQRQCQNRVFTTQQNNRANKRMRPATPDATAVTHSQIVAPFSIPNNNGSVLNHYSNLNNTNRVDPENTDRDQLSQAILEIITIILDKLKEQSSLRLTDLDLASLISSKLRNFNLNSNG